MNTSNDNLYESYMQQMKDLSVTEFTNISHEFLTEEMCLEAAKHNA